MIEWKYILDENGRTPIPVSDILTWAQWYEKTDRHVAFDSIGFMEISTVFLGLDQSFLPHPHAPILWETMIFHATGELEDYQERYTSYDDAVEGHNRAVALAMEQQMNGAKQP